MGKKLLIASLVVIDIGLVFWILAHNLSFPMFEPAGIVAQKEHQLFLTVVTLGLSVICTVVAITFFIIWKYRETNTKAAYAPESTGNKVVLFIWWLIPSVVIFILAVITWQSTHALDPYKPLASETPPLRIQVVALQWKWLFIYPEQHIASVNYVVFPEKTPITFELTSDAPMNSFWIPQLGGQLYAMSGMVTNYHLMADRTGEFAGSTAEISGEGFANMRFTAKSTTQDEFATWVEKTKQSPHILDRATYDKLEKPSDNEKVMFYASVDDTLYKEVVNRYMPANHAVSEHTMSDEHMMSE